MTTSNPTAIQHGAPARVGLLVTWAIVVVAALLVHLGDYPLYDADEARNGEVAREMAATNDYILPHLNGLPYLDKPIVFFASEALAMEVLGPTETAARLPAFFFMMLTGVAAGLFARRLWSREDGWIAGIITVAMPFTLAFSRTVIFDSTLAFVVTVAMIGFYLAVEEPERWRRWNVLAWAAIGIGISVKGPVALALPLMVAIPYALWRRRFRVLWSFAGLAVFLLGFGPWVWAVTKQVPDFLHYVLVTETMQRLATKALKRTGPPWYFIPYIIGGALPWSLVALGGWKTFRRNSETRLAQDHPTMFLLLWALIPFLFFSISQSKRPQYILPLMPAIALLVTRMWRTRSERVPGARVAGILCAIFGVLLIAAPFVANLSKHMKPAMVDGARIAAIGIGLAFLAGGVMAAWLPRSRELALIALTIPVIAIPIAAQPMLQAIGETRSTTSFVNAIRAKSPRESEIIAVGAYVSSLPFYFQHPVTVVSPDAEELTSNYLLRHYAVFTNKTDSPLHDLAWFRNDLSRCCSPRVYIIRANDKTSRQLFDQRGIRPLAEHEKLIAFGPYTGSEPAPLGVK